MGSRIYLDYNATAPVRPEVRAAVEPLLLGPLYGNASSVHWAGREAKRHLEAARRTIAELTDRKFSEVIFTSGGSEADNLALTGALGGRPQRVVVSAIEHPAVLETARQLAKDGVEVELVRVDEDGALDLEDLQLKLQSPTALVSTMAVNNETGVVFDVEAIADLAHAAGALLHVDAVQAAGRIPLPRQADLISLSGHKVGGLKGAGALITREDLALQPLVFGGPQERGRRAGTENVAAAVSLAEALRVAEEHRPTEAARLAALQRRLEGAVTALSGRILGGAAPRVSNTTLALFEGIDGEALLQALDLEGVAASSGSACSSGSLEPSHVLLAMGLGAEHALSAVRFSTGWATEPTEIEALAAALPRLVDQVRAP